MVPSTTFETSHTFFSSLTSNHSVSIISSKNSGLIFSVFTCLIKTSLFILANCCLAFSWKVAISLSEIIHSVKNFQPLKFIVATTSICDFIAHCKFLTCIFVHARIFHLVQIISSLSSFSNASTGIVTDHLPGRIIQSRDLNNNPSVVSSLELGFKVICVFKLLVNFANPFELITLYFKSDNGTAKFISCSILDL